MELIIKKTIGKTVYPFTFTGNTLHEVVMESQKLSFADVHECGCCGSSDLYLSAHVAEGFKYTEIRCNECRAELTFGVRKDNPEVSYLRRDEAGKLAWKKFQPDTSETTAPAGPKSAPPVQDPPKQQAEQRQTQKPPVQKVNNSNTTHRVVKPAASRQEADPKPTREALNYAIQLASAGNDADLQAVALLIKHDAGIQANQVDRKYLQTEYLKKFHLLTNPQAVAEQKEYAQLQA